MQIEKLMNKLGLGQLCEEPAAVAGGLLHKMYRVTTASGNYAVKVLNGEIMKRPTALQNTINSEKVALALADKVPVVAALELQSAQVHELEGAYYMIYPWVEGKSVFPREIQREHCEVIGDLLGRMHAANISVEGLVPEGDEAVCYPWETYLEQAKGLDLESAWVTRLKSALQDICTWNRAVCEAQGSLSANVVISHRDLDPKNVMWQGSQALVIDWEAAGYVNPYQELLEVVNYWADDGRSGLIQEYAQALIAAYRKHHDLSQVSWSEVFAGSYAGMLGWLEYNVKRALGIEACDEAEMSLGAEQVVGTIEALYAYQGKAETLMRLLS